MHDRPQRGAQPPGTLRVGVVTVAPAQGLGEVVVRTHHVAHELRAPRGGRTAQGLASALQRLIGEAVEGGVAPTARLEPVQREPPHALEHPVPRRRAGRVGDHQRGVHELVDQGVEALVVAVGARQPAGGAAIEGSSEHGEMLEQLALVRAEEVVGPPDRLGHAAVARRAAEPRPIEHVGALAEAFGDLGRTHRAGARGGDLQCEREPVQPAAQIHDGIEVGTLDAHTGLAGALEEQLDRRPGQRIGRADSRHLERRQRDDGLAGQLQRRPAGGQHRRLLADLEDAPDRAGRRLQEVLAVVDQEQHLAIAGRVQQRLERLEPQLRGERARDGVGIVDAGQVHAARAEREALRGARHRFVGECGLAHTARPDQRDETPGLQPAVDVVELVITTEQPHPRSRRQPTERGGPAGAVAASPRPAGDVTRRATSRARPRGAVHVRRTDDDDEPTVGEVLARLQLGVEALVGASALTTSDRVRRVDGHATAVLTQLVEHGLRAGGRAGDTGGEEGQTAGGGGGEDELGMDMSVLLVRVGRGPIDHAPVA